MQANNKYSTSLQAVFLFKALLWHTQPSVSLGISALTKNQKAAWGLVWPVLDPPNQLILVPVCWGFSSGAATCNSQLSSASLWILLTAGTPADGRRNGADDAGVGVRGQQRTVPEEVLANTWRTGLSMREEEEFWSYWRLFTDIPGLCTELLLAAGSENWTLQALLQPMGMQLWVWPEQWGLHREAQAESPHQGFLLLWFWLCTVTPRHLFPLEFGLSLSHQELPELMLQQDQWPEAEVSMWWAGIQLPAHPHKPLQIPPWSHSVVPGLLGAAAALHCMAISDFSVDHSFLHFLELCINRWNK